MKNNYIIIGDSIVYGIGGYAQNGWASMFKNRLLNIDGTKESSNYVHIVGFSGATSKEISEKIDSIINTFYFDEYNNIFVLAIGINDTQMFEGKNKSTIKEYKENLSRIIEKINKYKNNKIIVLGLTGIREKNKMFYWKPNKYYDNNTIANYDMVARELCNSKRIKYVPMLDVLKGEDFIDGLHPNDNGHKKIYEKLNTIIRETKVDVSKGSKYDENEKKDKSNSDMEKIVDLTKELQELKKKQFAMLKDNVEFIMNNNIKDIKKIEHTLDYLLECCYDKESENYYFKFCKYFAKVDKEKADFYISSFNKIYERNGDDDNKK